MLESDPYPKRMCHSCCSKLHNACTFVESVQQSDRELKELYKDAPTLSWPKPIQLNKNENIAIFGNDNVEIKEEVLSEDDNYDVNAAEEYNPDLLEIKIEPEEIIQPTPINITVNGKCFFLVFASISLYLLHE